MKIIINCVVADKMDGKWVVLIVMYMYVLLIVNVKNTISQAASRMLTHSGQYCTKVQNEMSASHTALPSSSEIRVPYWKHHSQFHNSSTVYPYAPDSCLTTLSDFCGYFFTPRGACVFLMGWAIGGSTGRGVSSVGCQGMRILSSLLTDWFDNGSSWHN